MEDRTELICYVTRQGETEEYKISLPGADYDIEDFIDSFVKPIMYVQLYDPQFVNESLNSKEEMWKKSEIAGEMSKL